MLSQFYWILRKSNLVPDSTPKLDKSKVLLFEDVEVSDVAALATIKWTKTLQHRNKPFKVPVLAINRSRLCCISALRSHMKRNRVKKGHPMFSFRDRHNNLRPLTYSMYNGFIKKSVVRIGLKKSGFSTHSLRRAGATWALECGVESDLIQLLGTWSSDCYKRYLDWSLSKRVEGVTRMADGIKAGKRK